MFVLFVMNQSFMMVQHFSKGTKSIHNAFAKSGNVRNNSLVFAPM
jgi:hypothetical protein